MAPANNAPILSLERRGYWIPLGIGALCLLMMLPAYPELEPAWRRGEYMVLVAVSLFVLVGIGFVWFGIHQWWDYRKLGPSPLHLDPHPGQAGGQIGGEIRTGLPWRDDRGQFELKLVCLQRSGRSNENSANTERMVWQHSLSPFGEPYLRGSRLRFCFDVPSHLPSTTPQGELDGRTHRHYWRLLLDGHIDGKVFSRSWEVPVIQGDGRCRNPPPAHHQRTERAQRAVEAQQSANRQIRVQPHAEGLQLHSGAGRNVAMSSGLLILGGLFGGGGAWILFDHSGSGWTVILEYLMGGIFGSVGLFAIGSALWLLGRSLRVNIVQRQVSTQRRWLGIPIGPPQYGELRRASQLHLSSSIRSGQGSDTVELMTLALRDNGREVRLAEGIMGREVGEALERQIVEMLRLR